jgi:hypothetical protein
MNNDTRWQTLQSSRQRRFGAPVLKTGCSRVGKSSCLHECHNDPEHCVFKTHRCIAEKYYWPRMMKDVKKYVNDCDICRSNKLANSNKTHLMGKYKKVHQPWQMISLDLQGPLPRSSAGHCWLLVITDWFTKYPQS